MAAQSVIGAGSSLKLLRMLVWQSVEPLREALLDQSCVSASDGELAASAWLPPAAFCASSLRLSPA